MAIRCAYGVVLSLSLSLSLARALTVCVKRLAAAAEGAAAVPADTRQAAMHTTVAILIAAGLPT